MTITEIRNVLSRDKHSETDIDYLLAFHYLGKSNLEWFEEVMHRQTLNEGVDDEGFPTWYEPLANAEIGLVRAKTQLRKLKQQ